MATAYRMSVVEALKSGQGTLPMKATYSSSSHCDDGKEDFPGLHNTIYTDQSAENSWSDDTTVSDFSPEKMKSPRTGHRADAVATGPDTEQNDPADTSTCGDGTGHVKLGAALSPPTSPADEASVKQSERALSNIRFNSDESKFMGMAQLNAILKSDTKIAKEFRKSKSTITECWDAIPGRFLDRLLAIAEFKGKEVVDRDWVTNHVVSFIHTAVQVLPESARNDKKFAKRIDKLLIITGLEM